MSNIVTMLKKGVGTHVEKRKNSSFLFKNRGKGEGKDYEPLDSLPSGAVPKGMSPFTHFLFSIQDVGTHFPLEMQSTLNKDSFGAN